MRNRKTREIANDEQKGQKRNLTYRALIQKYKAALKDCYYLDYYFNGKFNSRQND